MTPWAASHTYCLSQCTHIVCPHTVTMSRCKSQPLPFLRSHMVPEIPLLATFLCSMYQTSILRVHLVPSARLGFRVDNKKTHKKTFSLPAWIVSHLGRWGLYSRNNGTKNHRVHAKMRGSENKTHWLSSLLQAMPKLSGSKSTVGSQDLEASLTHYPTAGQ